MLDFRPSFQRGLELAMTSVEIMCVGARCAEKDVTRRLAKTGLRLCDGCGKALADAVAALPALHADCELLLAVTQRSGQRTSGGPLPGMPFNAAAADVRQAILQVLGSWSGMIAEQRGVVPPVRTVPALGAFLRRHVGWLAAHRAAGDASAEFVQLIGWARRVANPSELRRIPIAGCVEPNCGGFLSSAVDPRSPGSAVEVTCDRDADHRWSGPEWCDLARRVAGEQQPPGGRALRWLGAEDIARLWHVSLGSVYRLASERRWRREVRGGRTRYHEEDVVEAFRRRGGRTG